jgi:hypothetical protein
VTGDDVQLTVTPAVDTLERITLSPVTTSRAVGEVVNYTATGHYVGGGTQNITQLLVYASSDPAVADAPNAEPNRARVTAVGPGTATITARDPVSGITTTSTGDDATLGVLGALERITLSPVNTTRAVNEVLHYTAIGHYGGGTTKNITQQVTYTSSDPALASAPNEPGDKSKVLAVAPGEVTITATEPVSGVTTTSSGDDAQLRVIGALERITLAPVTAQRAVGQAQTYTATGHFAGGATKNLTQVVTYASSDPSVAAAPNLDGNRSRVDAVAPGTAVISATHQATGITTTQSGDDATLVVE